MLSCWVFSTHRISSCAGGSLRLPVCSGQDRSHPCGHTCLATGHALLCAQAERYANPQRSFLKLPIPHCTVCPASPVLIQYLVAEPPQLKRTCLPKVSVCQSRAKSQSPSMRLYMVRILYASSMYILGAGHALEFCSMAAVLLEPISALQTSHVQPGCM